MSDSVLCVKIMKRFLRVSLFFFLYLGSLQIIVRFRTTAECYWSRMLARELERPHVMWVCFQLGLSGYYVLVITFIEEIFLPFPQIISTRLCTGRTQQVAYCESRSLRVIIAHYPAAALWKAKCSTRKVVNLKISMIRYFTATAVSGTLGGSRAVDRALD